jgi:hypothetical protein
MGAASARTNAEMLRRIPHLRNRGLEPDITETATMPTPERAARVVSVAATRNTPPVFGG